MRPCVQMKFPPHEPFFPIEEDNTLLWTADNPAVWRRLEPILKLFTRFLHHSSATCWVCLPLVAVDDLPFWHS